MVNPNDKGKRAERQAAALLSSVLGIPVRRKLGAGRLDDVGDLDGIPFTVGQVRHQETNLGGVIKDKTAGAERQRLNAGKPFAFAMLRTNRVPWFVAMTPKQFAKLWRYAIKGYLAEKHGFRD